MTPYAVIRETIRSMDKVAIGRVVLTNREHIIALVPLEKGLMGMLLRYPYEVRSEKEYFDDIQDVKITKDMLDLARHIVEQKSGDFDPEEFEDHYETALIDLINKKRNGIKIAPKAAPKTGGNVINLMDALKKSLANEKQAAPPAKAKGKKSKRIEGQREMLLPIAGGQRQARRQGRTEEGGKAGASPCPRQEGRLARARHRRATHHEDFDGIGLPRLFQRRADRREFVVQPGADALDGGDDDDRDAGRDDAIFDRGGAGLIGQEFRNQGPH